MYSGCRLIAAASALAGGLAAWAGTPAQALRVCADPNNLPFSNVRGEGFENELAELIASDLGRKVSYFWWPQRRGFISHSLRTGACDLVLGVPASFELAATTRPYYRSTYVFVYRRDRGLGISSLNDPRLKKLRIGLHAVGDDYANVPPAQALANRGIVGNIVGYSIYGDYSKPNPPAALIDGVVRGDVDIAIAWGPLAGYFAKRASVPMVVVPVTPAVDGPALHFAFDIAMGVRRQDQALRRELDAFIVRHKSDIRRLLHRYGLPGD